MNVSEAVTLPDSMSESVSEDSKNLLILYHTVSVMQIQIRVFDDLKLKYIKPFVATTEFDGSLNNESDKTDLKSL